MENFSHKIIIWSAVANTAITTLAFFYFIVKEMVL